MDKAGHVIVQPLLKRSPSKSIFLSNVKREKKRKLCKTENEKSSDQSRNKELSFLYKFINTQSRLLTCENRSLFPSDL